MFSSNRDSFVAPGIGAIHGFWVDEKGAKARRRVHDTAPAP
jgi:hypothetical protein